MHMILNADSEVQTTKSKMLSQKLDNTKLMKAQNHIHKGQTLLWMINAKGITIRIHKLYVQKFVKFKLYNEYSI